MFKTASAALTAIALAGAFTACDSAPESAPAVTYYRDVKPVLDQHCVSCHREGGAGPFALDNATDAVAHAEEALTAIRIGYMPPWLPDPDCRRYQQERLMTSAEMDLIGTWVGLGAPAGDSRDSVPFTPVIESFEPTDSIAFGAGYAPKRELSDDYHCFVIDRDFPDDIYLTASQVVPGSGQVHHVLVYAIAPGQRAMLDKADADEPGEGYTCFGGPVAFNLGGGAQGAGFTSYFGGGDLPPVDFPAQLGAWVPGNTPAIRPDGQGTRILAGSRIVVQVHYNTLADGPAIDPGSTLDMRLTATEPSTLEVTRPIAILNLDIPAGEANAVMTQEFPYYGHDALTLQSVTGHMHLLGKELVAARVPASGEDECLLDIPKWDFHWQQSYRVLADDPIVIASGEKVRVSCAYDNSAGNQQVIGGQRVAPRDVAWGDGTSDEMCILYVSSVKPFTPAPPPSGLPCAGTEACIAACAEPGSLDCVLSCDSASLGCSMCAIRAGLRCSAFSCVGKLQSSGRCLQTCITTNIMMTSNVGLCLASECATAYADMLECMDPGFGAADCDAERATCGLPASP